MSARSTEVFRRVFRFHPRTWRDENEMVAIGILLDVAEASGRDRPSFSDRVSIYTHALSLRVDRVLGRSTRRTVASLALGTGIGLSVAYFIAFVLAPLAGDAYIPESKVTAGSFVVLPWLTAGVLAIINRLRGAGWAASFAVVVCVAVTALRLAQQQIELPSTVTLFFLAVWGGLATIAPVRRPLLWKTVGIVATCFLAVVMYAGLFGSSYDTQFWMRLSYGLFVPIAALSLCLVTAALCGRAATALAGIIYLAPWTALMIAFYARYGQPSLVIELMVIAWLAASLLVVWLARRGASPGEQSDLGVMSRER